MAAIGGDIIEITYNHPTLGQGVLLPKSNESFTLDLGGFRSNDDANMIDGGGQMIDQINRQRWSGEGTIAVDELQETQENMTALAGSPQLADWTFTHVNGTVYGGKGKPVGDIQVD